MRVLAAGMAALAILLAPGTARAADACPNGWSTEAAVAFAPPVPAVDSGVRNPERADGCTLLDVIWDGEPFSSHGRFVVRVARTSAEFAADGLLTPRQAVAVIVAAARSDVGKRVDRQIDNSCPSRVAFTFDDGTSVYRPRLLRLLREKQVHATFFDNGVRVDANPAIAAFQVREGHVELSHTYGHPHLNQLSPAAVTDEILRNEVALAAAGAPLAFKGIRPPFFEANARTRELIAGLGYTSFVTRIETDDYEPERTAAQIRDAIVAQLRPGATIVLHDGPIDTPAGAATVEAVGEIIDRARELGHCFGVVDRTGEVVADRYVSSSRAIPRIVNPVPYNPLVRAGTPPDPWVPVPSALRISAAHEPSTFVRGQGGTLTLTVANRSAAPTDGSTVTVTDPIPAGLTATAAAGDGWTCTGTATRRCTRSDVLQPGASYPPIAVSVTVAQDAPATITNAPRVVGHGGVWSDTAADAIGVG